VRPVGFSPLSLNRRPVSVQMHSNR
jgi:hypothetical protein